VGSMAEKRPQRPLDVNQWAKQMLDLATMDDVERTKLQEKQAKAAKRKKSQTPGRRGSVK
jgi:hypothetical protein